MLLLPRVHLLTFFAQVWADGFGMGALAHFGAVALSSTNFWDPAGFTADGSVENFKRRRQTELKHGLSTSAWMGQRLGLTK